MRLRLERYPEPETEGETMFNTLDNKVLTAINTIQDMFPVGSGGRLEFLLGIMTQQSQKERLEWRRALEVCDLGMKNANRKVTQPEAGTSQYYDERIKELRKMRKLIEKREARYNRIQEGLERYPVELH